MADARIGQIDLAKEYRLRQVAVLLLGTEDFYERNLRANSSLWTGRHIAAFDPEGDWIAAYADCQLDGTALQFAGDDSLRAKFTRELLGVPGSVG